MNKNVEKLRAQFQILRLCGYKSDWCLSRPHKGVSPKYTRSPPLYLNLLRHLKFHRGTQMNGCRKYLHFCPISYSAHICNTRVGEVTNGRRLVELYWESRSSEYEVFTAVTIETQFVPSSGISRRVAFLRADVSEERIFSIITVTRISELGTTLAVTSSCSTPQEVNFFLARLSCHLDDGGDAFLRNVSPYKSHMAWHSRRRNSS
jgi:hypothetical protein